MVAFKRFFLADRGHADQDAHTGMAQRCDLHKSISLNPKGPQPPGAEHHFYKIERQFETMHDQLQARPKSPHSQTAPSRASSRLTDRNPRHVDLVEALFSSHRYHMQSAASLSPTSPYNEDIAERNMTSFLKNSRPKKNVYSRIISALYQEDVADRNIAKYSSSRPASPNKRTRSRGRSFQSLARSSRARSGSGSRSRSRATPSKVPAGASDGDSSALPQSCCKRCTPSSQQSTPNESPIRQHRSTPILSSERPKESPRASSTSPERHLGVPPAHKQGKRWTNVPLPDSPTLPMTIRREVNINETRSMPDLQSTWSSSSRTTGLTSQSPRQRPSMAPRAGSKKNVRDLSINTELAARGRSTKIAHRAIQPPTPTNIELKHNPSIAEVMNSPPPAGTPTSISPLPPSSAKVAEIMDMFRQAYSSTHAVTTHPTFETLQEAIIREINSHEAFQRVPVPDQGPPFTPSSNQTSFDRSISSSSTGLRSSTSPSSRTLSLKDTQLSKLMQRGSSKKPRRNSEARRSISTSVPSRVFRRASEVTGRRRHTDAPPPSPGLFDSMPDEQVTYMDILLRSQKSSPNFGTRAVPDPVAARHLGHSQSLGTISTHGTSDISTTVSPSIFYMRAQTSASSSDSHPSFSVDDSDEEVIQLPSVGVPHVQIQAVDENNVTYVAGNTSPQTAYRLMNWPRKAGRTVSLRSHPDSHHQHSASQSSARHRPLIRAARSVESY